MSRGNDGAAVFYDDQDKARFLDALGEMSGRFEFSIFAYTLMDNHYHLLLKTHRANLSKGMQWLGVTFTRRFNNKHVRSGHLFQGRFKSIIVENDAYLMQLSFYIHRNPLRAGIVQRLTDYKWSSYPVYAYGKKPPDWLSTQSILSRFRAKDKHKAYREKAQRYAKEEKRLWEELRYGMFLGSKRFVDRIRSVYLPDKPHQEIPQQKLLSRDIGLEQFLKTAATILGFDLKRFVKSTRIAPTDKADRDLLLYFAWKSGLFTNEKIGSFFNITYSAVSHGVRSVRSGLIQNHQLKEKLNSLNSQFKI
jgi:REP element-mobilizing transposase RayT